MGLRVVGTGLGRTGTHSLNVAFEQLLGGPCCHMLEVLGHFRTMTGLDAGAGTPA